MYSIEYDGRVVTCRFEGVGEEETGCGGGSVGVARGWISTGLAAAVRAVVAGVEPGVRGGSRCAVEFGSVGGDGTTDHGGVDEESRIPKAIGDGRVLRTIRFGEFDVECSPLHELVGGRGPKPAGGAGVGLCEVVRTARSESGVDNNSGVGVDPLCRDSEQIGDEVSVAKEGSSSRPLANRKNRVRTKARGTRNQGKEVKGSDGWTADKGSREDVVSSDLRGSLERKWIAENELAVLKAQRQLEILKSNDIDGEIRRYRTKISRDTEGNMVKIEKLHATLKATGNVPGCIPVDGSGSVETVLSDGMPGLSDGSISPNSSASMAEFRACQKKLLDSEERNAQLMKKLEKMSITETDLDMLDKETFTDNSVNADHVERMYPHLYGATYKVMRGGVQKFKNGYDFSNQW